VPGGLRAVRVACGVCHQDLAEAGEAVACRACGTPAHRDCWEYLGICSLYGCGETRAAPVLDLAAGHGGALRIREEDAEVELRRDRLLGASRWLRGRLREVPGSLAATAAWTGLGFGLLYLAQGRVLPGLWWALGLAAALHGLVAPLLASAQHRHPWRTGALALALALGLLPLTSSGPASPWLVLPALTMVVALMVFASSLSDFLAGPRTALGQRLGRAAQPLRVLLVAVLGAAGSLVMEVAFAGGAPLAPATMRLALVAGLALGLGAAPAMERAKGEFRRRLPPGRR